jgi:hypothetical protein
MEAARTSETSVDNYFRRQYIPEDKSELHIRRRENLKSHIKKHGTRSNYTSSLLSCEAVKTNSPLLPLLLKHVAEMLLSVPQTYAALSLVLLLLLKCCLPITLKCTVIKED